MEIFLRTMILFVAFFSTYLLYPFFIDFLRRNSIGQFIRKEGPDLHNYKEGTPTMGGLLFIASGSIFGVLMNPVGETFFLVLAVILFAFIGLLDDWLSVRRKNAEGLKVYQKFLLQIVFAILLVLFSQMMSPHTHILLPFSNQRLELGFFYYIFTVFVIVAISNAVNLTDGLDGLAGSVFLSTAVPLYVFYRFHGNDFPILLTFSLAVCAFLFYNFKPAKVFMGDTGAIALGGLLGGVVSLTGTELFLLFFALIFFVETLSVLIQVGWYKITKRRVFKMSPLHHHYELKGYSEESIVFRFSVVNLIAALLILGVYK